MAVGHSRLCWTLSLSPGVSTINSRPHCDDSTRKVLGCMAAQKGDQGNEILGLADPAAGIVRGNTRPMLIAYDGAHAGCIG